MAYLRQRLRVRDTEEIIRILLLSSDTSLITDTLTSPGNIILPVQYRMLRLFLSNDQLSYLWQTPTVT